MPQSNVRKLRLSDSTSILFEKQYLCSLKKNEWLYLLQIIWRLDFDCDECATMSLDYTRETSSQDIFTTTVLDLPQLYARPKASELLQTLQLLEIKPPSWDHDSYQQRNQALYQVSEEGIPKYLTGIVASKLGWVDEDWREEIWETASKRLSERSGRTGTEFSETC